MFKKAALSIYMLVLLTLLTNCGSASSTSTHTGTQNGGNRMILVFSKTTGYRHASIENGKEAIRKLAAEHNVGVDTSEDASIFTSENLRRYQAVVFLNTTGNILDPQQKAAFEGYIRAGGGYAGIHSATDTEYSWTWYGELVGAFFKSHPHIQQATLHIEDQHHPSTSMLPQTWVRTDEWYNFRTNPRDHVHVLITLDETSYTGGTMGKDHPISWYHTFDGGRAWYTGMGHTPESFSEPLFLQHLWGGIAYAAGYTTA